MTENNVWQFHHLLSKTCEIPVEKNKIKNGNLTSVQSKASTELLSSLTHLIKSKHHALCFFFSLMIILTLTCIHWWLQIHSHKGVLCFFYICVWTHPGVRCSLVAPLFLGQWLTCHPSFCVVQPSICFYFQLNAISLLCFQA